MVGSIAHKKREFDRQTKIVRLPFSRKGRGPAHIIKPEVMDYGGNAGVTDDGEITETPVLSFTPDGSITGKAEQSFQRRVLPL